MRLLCDTQIIIWLMQGQKRIKSPAAALLADRSNEVLFSSVSLWEVAMKMRIAKIRTGVAALQDNCRSAGMSLLKIEVSHLAVLAGMTETLHNDPFDHLLIAQAIAEDAALVTSDRIVQCYPIEIIKA